MLAHRANLIDAQRLVAAIQQAGGRVPEPLTNILGGSELLKGQGAPADPVRKIVALAQSGRLDAETLAELIESAAATQMIANYAADLRLNGSGLFMAAFYTELQNGAADSILDSLRGSFDEHAEAIAAARDLIPTEQPAEQFLNDAKPAALQAWQGLNEHLAVINAIAAIASQFSCRGGKFPLIEEYANSDGFRLDDRAIFCCDGPNLALDSQPFGRPDQGHRTSPWFRTTLKLHTVDSARARHRVFAASEWERQHSGPVEQWIDEHGQAHEFKKPANPYLDPEPAH